MFIYEIIAEICYHYELANCFSHFVIQMPTIISLIYCIRFLKDNLSNSRIEVQ